MAVVAGLDEVGRGCWAGPLVAAVVALDAPIVGLRDSKKLSKKRRVELDVIIRSQAKGYGVGWVTPGEIDQFGLTKSVRLAMLRAMKKLHEQLQEYNEIIIDGNQNFLANVHGLMTANIKTLIKADDLVPAVSAASIVAKVARDAYMAEAATNYPHYGFDTHVGYGTAAHIEALKIYGVTDIHRKSYKPVQEYLT